MGNSNDNGSFKEESKQLTFEENKKEYFSYVRQNLKSNVNEIVKTLNTSTTKTSSNSLNLSDNSDNPNAWQTFLIAKLMNYKARMNQSSIGHHEAVINYIENMVDTNDAHVLKLKFFLSKEIDESRSKIFLFVKDDEKDVHSSNKKEGTENIIPSKNAIILRSIDFIFDDLDNFDHPLNKVARTIKFNYANKYEQELLDLEKSEEQKSLEFELTEEKKLEISKNIRSATVSVQKNKEKENEKKNLSLRKLIPLGEISKFYSYIKEELTNISFIIILSVIKFYGLIEEPEMKVIDILGEKVKDLLISGDLLRLLQKIKSILLKDTLYRYNEKFLEFYNLEPKDLGISPYFSFDKDFRLNISSSIGIADMASVQSNIPFPKSIIFFREINKSVSIMKKLEIMFSLRDVILKEIDEFWKGFFIQQKKRYVDADNLLSIFIYLAVKSQLCDLIIDIEIIDDFISKSLKLSRKGKRAS